MKSYQSSLELIGNTPLVKLNHVVSEHHATIYGKCEWMNPGGSVKDRAALAMIEAAEDNEVLSPDSVVIEPTSGNTGISMAMVCAIKGYKVILTMPDSMTLERRALLDAYGAELVLTPGHLGMLGAIDKAMALADEYGSLSFVPHQFKNSANPLAHQNTTGTEIWTDTDGKVDVFVTAVGTGGTISGVGRYLKEKNSEIRIVAVEPENSAVLSGGEPGPHMIQGIGAGFIPDNYDETVIDDVIKISNEEAFAMTRKLALKEGLLLGVSAGANVAAAHQIAKTLPSDQVIVTMLCDVGERYLSTTLFQNKGDER